MRVRGLLKKKSGGGVGGEKEGGSILVAEVNPVFQHPFYAEGPKTVGGIPFLVQ